MTFNAQYGNSLAFYGNIELGVWVQPLHPYGAWPTQVPPDGPMLSNLPDEEEVIEQPDTTIIDNIAIIKRLKAELQEIEDLERRREIRLKIELARSRKEEAFRRAAKLAAIDEEESLFMLLH